MTNEEALEVCRMALKTFSLTNGTFRHEDGVKQFIERMRERYDVETMVKALEKQTPKKPERFINDLDIFGKMVGYRSACCGIALRIRHDGDPEPMDYYCPECGQKVDWSDTDL